jgi:hypothetical protein
LGSTWTNEVTRSSIASANRQHLRDFPRAEHALYMEVAVEVEMIALDVVHAGRLQRYLVKLLNLG